MPKRLGTAGRNVGGERLSRVSSHVPVGFDMKEGITSISYYREQDAVGAEGGCLPVALRSQGRCPARSDN